MKPSAGRINSVIIEQKVIFTTAVAVTHNGKAVDMFDNDGAEVKHFSLAPWVKFVAVDADGTVYAYQVKPNPDGFMWKDDGSGKICKIGFVDDTYSRRAWVDSLIEIKPIPGV
ncbi:uncharacterized protein [Enterobacter phage ATCEA85]|nr:uncharacterized protein [Enterobacter phage ATCEA85]